MIENNTEMLIYNTVDGQTKIDVKLENETVWLTQAQMAELFQTSTQNITMHIKNLYNEGELIENSTCKEYLQVQNEGNREVKRSTKTYSLDVIISVGYRVKSLRGTQFRIWATERLKEYIIKGFTMNDDLLKKAGGGKYFDELLARIRDIRSSEKVFYSKVLEIYATSVDYDPRSKTTQTFFATVQNKMHFSAHGETAAEVIYSRVNADKPFVGLTSWTGEMPKKSDIKTAKNYLTEDEVDTLNRIVNMYLEFAELQAKSRKPMYMVDWITKLDDFIKVSGREVLEHAGKISHEEAMRKANEEYEKYKEKTKDELSEVEKHFLESIDKTVKMLGKNGGVGK
ncbi:MAG TPA: cell filamentation protein Fic [Clostridiales bacterium]|nr:MAG: cell filamentation protein Fic [Clostridiales bacterium GWD2_32_19]HCC07351.1 cell filamentation protein Fic [Clostridiales bacterium]